MRNSANPSMPDTNIHSGMKSVKESAGHAQEAAAVKHGICAPDTEKRRSWIIFLSGSLPERLWL